MRIPSTRTHALSCFFFPARPESKTTWHHVLSFNPFIKDYLCNLQKGSHVYVEAGFELREPDPSADPTSYQGQRQIFLRHGTCSVSHLPHARLMLYRKYPGASWPTQRDRGEYRGENGGKYGGKVLELFHYHSKASCHWYFTTLYGP